MWPADGRGEPMPELDPRLRELAEAAAGRFERRARPRAARLRALRAGRLTRADTPARLEARLDRLGRAARAAAARLDAAAIGTDGGRAAAVLPSVPPRLDDASAREAMIGLKDFLSVEFLERGVAAARTVGRIVLRHGPRLVPRGTGFLVAPGVLLTNEHVLGSPAEAAVAALQLDLEANGFGPPLVPQTFALEPERLFLHDRALDLALVAVAGRSREGAAVAGYGWSPLDGRIGKVTIGEPVNLVQHPQGREKEVVLRGNRLVDLLTGPAGEDPGFAPFLHYEADTEPGSSGAPVFNDGWEVVALHHSAVPARDAAGRWLARDGSVWVEGRDPPAAIAWVANEGVRVSALVGALEAALGGLSGEAARLLEAVLDAGRAGAPAPEPRLGPAPAEEAAPAGGTPQAAGRVSVQVPLTLELTLSSPVPGRVELRLAGPGGADAEERLRPADYADRAGFDRGFLGFELALPGLVDDRHGPLAELIGRPGETELRYHHFSVLVNARRRLACLSAVNVDFDAPVALGREAGTGRWRYDPRLSREVQAGEVYYRDNPLDRGHLTRRADAAWGRDQAEALAANDDTFHWTNCAPQHEDFNRSTVYTSRDLKLWGDLENHIAHQGSLQRIRVSVLNGPIFSDNDLPLGDLLVPRAFFKIVVFAREDGRPGALGFVLEQSDLLARRREEAIEAGEFRLRQRPLAAIAAATGLDLGRLVAWDPLAGGRTLEATAAARDRPIARLADILL